MLEEISSLCGKTLADNPQPVLSVSLLQRLDKDDGEVLLLCGRMKPCITRLADISSYDKDHIVSVPVHERNKKILPALDFELPLPNSINQVHPDYWAKKVSTNQNVDIEDLIARIDKRIAELEEEEAANNLANEKTDNSEKKDSNGGNET